MSNRLHPKSYVCRYTASVPALDGKLEGAEWESAPWTDTFIDIKGENVPPLRTKAKLLWDNEFLYIGAELEEPQVWATLTERDSVIFHDNDFEVFLDPDGVCRNYLELEINAFGTVWDLRLEKPYRAGGDADNTFCFTGLKSAVHIDGNLNDPSSIDKGWSVTLALPFADIAPTCQTACPPSLGDVWRLNFSRVQWDVDADLRKIPNRREHNWVWSPMGKIDMHRPEIWGYLLFGNGDEEPYADPDWPERATLHEAYYEVEDCLPPPPGIEFDGLKLTSENFEIEIETSYMLRRDKTE